MRYTAMFAVLAFALLLAGCVNAPKGVGNATHPVVAAQGSGSPANGTQQPAAGTQQPAQLPPDYSVELGDIVWVDYTLWVQGKVYDTNNATLANESGIYSPNRKYEPFRFNASFNSGTIDGFVINTLGMKINETVSFSVDPARGYGPWDPKKVFTIPRYSNMSLYETIPLSYLAARNITNLTNGTSFDTEVGTVFIADMNEENATIYYLLQKGEKSVYNGIPITVADVDATAGYATLERTFQVNKTYVLHDPATGRPTKFLVTGKTSDTVTLDSNHPLANETLRFKVTLLKAERPG